MSDSNFANNLVGSLGVTGLISMIVSLVCIGLSWWALQHVKLDLFVRFPKSPQGKLLHLLLAIVLGHFVAKFLLDYLNWSQMIKYMF